MGVSLAVVEPNPVVRLGLCTMLDRCDEVHVELHVSGVDDLGLVAEPVPYDVTVMGPGIGLDDVEHLATLEPARRSRLILFAEDPSPLDLLRTIVLGVAAVLSHDSDIADMQNAISIVRRTGTFLGSEPTNVLASVAAGIRNLADRYDYGLVEQLSEREFTVLAHLGRGCGNAQISRSMYVSESSVKAHVSHLLSKLGVANRAEAAVLASLYAVTAPKGAVERSRGEVDAGVERPSVAGPPLVIGSGNAGTAVAAARRARAQVRVPSTRSPVEE
jgi:DNA-binding NarL/FixJ family response regulator